MPIDTGVSLCHIATLAFKMSLSKWRRYYYTKVMIDTLEDSKQRKYIGYIALSALIIHIIYYVSTFSPVTSGGNQTDIPYQVILGVVNYVAHPIVIALLILFFGSLPAILNKNGYMWSVIPLIAIGLLSCIGAIVIPRNGDDMFQGLIILLTSIPIIAGLLIFRKAYESSRKS